MATNFEAATLDLLKKILKQPNVRIGYIHKGAEDPYYIHRVTMNDKEIFEICFSETEKTTLTINRREQDWSQESLKELHLAAQDQWWARQRAADEKKKQREQAETERRQAETTAFLEQFLAGQSK